MRYIFTFGALMFMPIVWLVVLSFGVKYSPRDAFRDWNEYRKSGEKWGPWY